MDEDIAPARIDLAAATTENPLGGKPPGAIPSAPQVKTS
jgi:hypothetical protein